jgi:hypothetical protein
MPCTYSTSDHDAGQMLSTLIVTPDVLGEVIMADDTAPVGT